MRILLFTHFVMWLTSLCAQHDSSSIVELHKVAVGVRSIQKQASSISTHLDKKTEHCLQKLSQQEQIIKAALWKTDSLKAKELFGDIEDRYYKMAQLLHPTSNSTSPLVYIGKLDSLGVSLELFKQLYSAKGKVDGTAAEVDKTINGLKTLQQKLDASEKIRTALKQRQQMIAQALGKTALAKNMKNYNKQAYYYQQQLQEYRTLLKDPKQMGQRLLKELRKHPAFATYFSKYAQWASLFGLPTNTDGSMNNAVPIAGLQTRAALQTLLNDRFGAGPNMEQLLQTQASTVAPRGDEMIPNNGLWTNGSGDEPQTDFKPNTQKTKSFWKRIEMGTNMQSNRGTRYLPVSSDWGLSAGYKLNDQSIIGIGISYSMGWGKDIQHIKITSNGAGLRSFLDYKLKGGLWISGGAEMNYRNSFNVLEMLADTKMWQKTGLVGFKKNFKSNKYSGNIRLLYKLFTTKNDFSEQPFIFRIGYNINK